MTTSSRYRKFVSLAMPAVWSSVDQVLSSVSNFVVVLAVARGGGADTLGRYAIAFAAYLTAMGVARALFSEPLLAAPPDRDDPAARSATMTLTLGYSIAVALLFAGAGFLLSRPELAAMGLLLPGVLLQDLLRFHAFRNQRAVIAAGLDGVWLLGVFAVWPLLTTRANPVVAVLGWGAGGVAATVLGLAVTRERWATPGVASRWWRSEARRLAAPLVADSLAGVAATQGSVFIVVLLIGDGAMGMLRAGQVYFSPLGLLLTAGGLFAIPRLARRPDSLHARRLALATAALVTASTIVVAAIVLSGPALRHYLFADAIEVPSAVLVPLACQIVLIAASVAFVIAAKVQNRGTRIVRSRLISGVVGLAAAGVGTILFGLVGAAWAAALQAGVFAAGLAWQAATDATPRRGVRPVAAGGHL